MGKSSFDLRQAKAPRISRNHHRLSGVALSSEKIGARRKFCHRRSRVPSCNTYQRPTSTAKLAAREQRAACATLAHGGSTCLQASRNRTGTAGFRSLPFSVLLHPLLHALSDPTFAPLFQRSKTVTQFSCVTSCQCEAASAVNSSSANRIGGDRLLETRRPALAHSEDWSPRLFWVTPQSSGVRLEIRLTRPTIVSD